MSIFDGGLPRDCMYDVLGVHAHEVKLLLSYFFLAKCLTLDDYNKRLFNFILATLKLISLFHLSCPDLQKNL